VARWFPSKLHHAVPAWVEAGALFHIRIRIDRTKEQQSLVIPSLAEGLIESANFIIGETAGTSPFSC
jgi:hypothetical protein